MTVFFLPVQRFQKNRRQRPGIYFNTHLIHEIFFISGSVEAELCITLKYEGISFLTDLSPINFLISLPLSVIRAFKVPIFSVW